MWPIIWGVAAVVFLIVEALTVSTVSIWFVGGAIVSCVLAALGLPVWLQMIAFVGVSGTLVGCLRKKLKDLSIRKPKGLPKENITSDLEGKIAVVTSSIEPGATGQIKYDGILWSARGMDEEDAFSEGSKVIICHVDGICCVVDKYELK